MADGDLTDLDDDGLMRRALDGATAAFEELMTVQRSAPGAQLFIAEGCATCHTGPDTTSLGVAPSLVDASGWAGRRRPGMNAETYLVESMLAPSAFISPAHGGGGLEMPSLVLSSDEVDALVGYLLAD